jgi:hypothetical protein
MAIQATGRVIAVPAAEAGTTPIFTHMVKVEHIEFVGYTVETHVCAVQDRQGRKVWDGNGKSDLSAERSGKIGWVDGLVVPTCDSGEVRIYLL